MSSWLSEFEGQGKFGSGAIYIEMQLRQALAATQTERQPDSFRTACVCECLARLPDAAGSFAGVLKLLRGELLKAVYVNHESLERRRRRVDAQGLLECKTYFDEVATLQAKIVEQNERLADWQRAKQELAQDADGRNELLRLAVARWNTVLSTIKGEMRSHSEVQETARKLSALLDSMLQHSKAIDELQRISLLEPVERLHAQVGSLGSAMCRRLLVALLESYGGAALAQTDDAERLDLLHALLMGIDRHEREGLVRRLASHEGLVGGAPNMVASLTGGLPVAECDAFLLQQCRWHAGRLKEGGRRSFLSALEAIAKEDTAGPRKLNKITQDGQGIKAFAAAETQTAKRDLDDHADLLASVAADVGSASVDVLPAALQEMEEQRRRGEASFDELALRPLVKALDFEIVKLKHMQAAKHAASASDRFG